MECAVILGKRGMRRVHLVDADEEMGGIMRWIPSLPGLGEWGRVVSYCKAQIAKLRNVEFIPNRRLDAQQVLEYGAEIVVVSTGAKWVTDGVTAKRPTGRSQGRTHVSVPRGCSPPTLEQVMVEGKELRGEQVSCMTAMAISWPLASRRSLPAKASA